jgi:hypothetical protein
MLAIESRKSCATREASRDARELSGSDAPVLSSKEVEEMVTSFA